MAQSVITGHDNYLTTEIYTHLSTSNQQNIKSSVDNLQKKKVYSPLDKLRYKTNLIQLQRQYFVKGINDLVGKANGQLL